MESVNTYKKQRKPKPNLMPTPPYCRKYEQEMLESEVAKAPMLELSDPGKILLLTESLINNNTLDLEKKINYYLERETSAEKVFIVTLVALSEEAVVQVIGQDILETEFRAPICNQVFMDVVEKRNSRLCQVTEFHEQLQIILEGVIVKKENKVTEVITVPVFSKLKKGSLFALPVLICVVNSPKSEDIVSTLVAETFRFCLPILMNTSKLEEEARIKRQCQSLLRVARKLFSHLDDLSMLLKEIMSEARRLTNAERCSLFLLDPDHIHLVAKVFDGGLVDDYTPEVRIAKDQGIAGHVAATGKILNIKDAYNHPLFYKGMDEATGFRTKNILCFPIQDETGIVGVAQLCNKIQGDFDFFDEEVALAFSIYCGLSIVHTLVYKKLQEAQNHYKVSNELMLYHMKVSTDDVKQVLLCTNRHSYLDYNTFLFIPKHIPETETPCQVLRIFEELKFFEKFRIKREIVTKFVLYVKKGYRDTPYHNWMHAFSVTHFAYVAIKQLNLIENGYLTYLEALAFITSCLCHDIDHRGTTNSFHLESDSVLANLYSSQGSVMERHHLSQTLCILNTEDCNFLASLGYADYIYCLDFIRDMILATDLANYFNIRSRLDSMIENGFDKSSTEDKYILNCLLISCSDLSDQTKNWDVVKNVAQSIYEEFFTQGDLEKAMGKTPEKMMDREEAAIPDLQIEFLNKVCLPMYSTLYEIFPETEVLVKNITKNVLCWEACKPIFNRFKKKGMQASLELLSSPEIEEEVNKVLELYNET